MALESDFFFDMQKTKAWPCLFKDKNAIQNSDNFLNLSRITLRILENCNPKNVFPSMISFKLINSLDEKNRSFTPPETKLE